MEDIVRELETEKDRIQTIIDHVKRPRTLYVVQYMKTGDVEGVWTNIDTILRIYKRIGFVPKDDKEKMFLFPVDMSYLDIGKGNLYRIQEVPIDKSIEG